MTTQLKISFCTVCMNRLHHLKQTLPVNLQANASYQDLEFVLLDYNSTDGLEEWIKCELEEYIQSGRLVYYKTTEPKYFHRSHSRNMVFKLATGDVVCNIDADNFTGKDFAHYLNAQFTTDKNIFVAADTSNRHYFIRDVCGRICLRKEDFDAIGGFDEYMEGYGDEDRDLINRLKLLGRQEIIILDRRFLTAIKHSDMERVQNEFTIANLANVYISHETPYSSTMMLLFKDGTLDSGTIVDKIAQDSMQLPTIESASAVWSPNDQYTLSQYTWTRGAWFEKPGIIIIETDGNQHSYLDEGSQIRNTQTDGIFIRIDDESMIIEAINFHSRMKNTAKLNDNSMQRRLTTNDTNTGRGTVVKNFMHDRQITV